ncbi:MAG: nucleotide exchange factor GrpE [Planctomycetaceae bacterium]|nr:nucleotide exchange factor GrpE [Planctomycetaceae bacterium]
MSDESNPDRPSADEEFEATDAAFESQQDDEPDSETDASEQPETRDEEMERLRHTAAEAEKRVLMAQAEAENFRKRMRRDFEDQLKYAAVPMVGDLLEVRDNLLRALEAADQSDQSSSLKEGVAMVAKQLADTLTKYGVREIPAEGEVFDPNFHEAISQMPGDQPSGNVAHVALSGFMMHERVVRPSQVVVSTGPA